MQSVRTDTQAVNATQSLAAIQTLLKAGLGCITFLRNLLPDDNFTESYFTTSDDILSSDPSDSSNYTDRSTKGRNSNAFKIMTMTRGYTDEADRLMNYLEHGIFDALQRQYLRSFIFAIYLIINDSLYNVRYGKDHQDPTNIVEAYTFNFQYFNVPGTNVKVPVMSLGAAASSRVLDPVADAAKCGRPPTVKDVKKSVKALLKTLIHAMSQMDVLPRRRFATFKLFYTDSTPADYEPPYFQPADAKNDQWYFMTHALDEIPDKWSIGHVMTGHHSIDLNVTSIATYLPTSTEHDQAAFTGITPRLAAPPISSPGQESTLRAQQAEQQAKDAMERNIVWAVEGSVEPDRDAEGEDDPEYLQRPNGTYQKTEFNSSALLVIRPIGTRDDAGDIQLFKEPLEGDEALYGGTSITVPTRLDEMNVNTEPEIACVGETQIASSQADGEQSRPSDTPMRTLIKGTNRDELNPDPSLPQRASNDIDDIGTQMFHHLVIEHPDPREDTHMLVLDTQMNTVDGTNDPIESFQTIETRSAAAPIINARLTDNGLECDCGITKEDECCFCEGGCGRWYHVWCIGYHSTKDARIPTIYLCFDCRVRADPSWDLIKTTLYPSMISNYRELALFRRAIKTAQTKKPMTATEFSKALGGDSALARRVFKRLEVEDPGFIHEQVTSINELGFAETSTRKGKGKGKQVKQHKHVLKQKYLFDKSILSTSKYHNYFNPDPHTERVLIGIAELEASIKGRQGRASSQQLSAGQYMEVESQTQNETQILGSSEELVKRPRPDDAGSQKDKPQKRIKVSVAAAVDLAE